MRMQSALLMDGSATFRTSSFAVFKLSQHTFHLWGKFHFSGVFFHTKMDQCFECGEN